MPEPDQVKEDVKAELSDIPEPPDSPAPPVLRKLLQRLNKDVELYKLHVKHYHMSTAQFRKRTSELALPEAIYQKYDKIVKGCKICSELAPAPTKPRVTGMRAEKFGDLLFVDHLELTWLGTKYAVLLMLDGATHLLWARPQQTLSAEDTLQGFREWMDHNQCIPRVIVSDMAFTTVPFVTFYAYHGIRNIATGPRTPWPNRAESAVRLFKRMFAVLAEDASGDITLRSCTFRQLVQKCCWARNNCLLLSGRTPIELATGRRPAGLQDLELLSPEQLTAEPHAEDHRSSTLQRLAMKAHLTVQQMHDI